jgi:hypothetical protein
MRRDRLAIGARVLGIGIRDRDANAVLRLAFMSLELSEVVSFTAALNVRSRGVMERLGNGTKHKG